LATLALSALADEAPRTPTGSRDAVRTTAGRVVDDAEKVLAVRLEDERPFAIEGRAWEARLRAEELRLEWLLGGSVDLADLVGRWRLAAELFAELGHVYEEARARTHLALVLRAAGEGDASQQEAATARAAASRLRATALLEDLGSTLRAGAADAGSLTPREREILALVAAGRSNGEIGKQLFISAKTVSVHVSNVMAKLGAGSRTEASALARRAGLID
jgi:DNA-binding CsgD family transcriptional regulator